MSPRRKYILDADVLQHVGELLLERGAAAVTFAEVSKRCGLAAPTLVQRFGTREAMLAAVMEVIRGRIIEAFAHTRQGASPLAELRAALQTLARPAVLEALDAAASHELRKQISYALIAAVDRGELPRCDVASFARVLQIAFYGSILAARSEGIDIGAEVDHALDSQLASYI